MPSHGPQKAEVDEVGNGTPEGARRLAAAALLEQASALARVGALDAAAALLFGPKIDVPPLDGALALPYAPGRAGTLRTATLLGDPTPD